MMKSIFLTFVLVFSSIASGEKKMVETDILEVSKSAINHCIFEYSRLSGNPFFNEVDKAYVHVSSNRLGVIFAHGEVGTFGKRSTDYRSYLSCGVLASDDLKIYYMSSPMSEPLIESPESDAIDDDFYEGEVKELLYKRGGDEFTFVAIQDFSEPDLNLPPQLD